MKLGFCSTWAKSNSYHLLAERELQRIWQPIVSRLLRRIKNSLKKSYHCDQNGNMSHKLLNTYINNMYVHLQACDKEIANEMKYKSKELCDVTKANPRGKFSGVHTISSLQSMKLLFYNQNKNFQPLPHVSILQSSQKAWAKNVVLFLTTVLKCSQRNPRTF